MSGITITIAQINPTVGDVEGNTQRIIDLAESEYNAAGKNPGHMIVFPELSVTGYYPGDMLNDPAFIERVVAAFDRILEASRGRNYNLVFGMPTPRKYVSGKPLHNKLLVVGDHCLKVSYAKQLLPTYDVFDECRHFEPGPEVAATIGFLGYKIGFLICEDGWNQDGLSYSVNPWIKLAAEKPDLVVSINASPSNIGKREQRHQLFSKISRQYGIPILWVNQVGGQDQVVYDGASFLYSPRAGFIYEAASFQEETHTFRLVGLDNDAFRDAEHSHKIVKPESSDHGSPFSTEKTRGWTESYSHKSPGNKEEFYRQQIVLGIRDYARRCGFKKAVVGSSGGIDSALTLALAAEALGPDKVEAITMPSDFSSSGSVSDSEKLCANLHVKLHKHPISEIVAEYEYLYEKSFGRKLEGVPLQNLQARIRGTILMEFSNDNGHLLLTTGNKSEIAVGYCTLYGDTNGGLGPIGDLYKTEVFPLCRHLNEDSIVIPEEILEKPPSAELAPGQKDTDNLPPYNLLDPLLMWLLERDCLAKDQVVRVDAVYKELMETEEGRNTVAKIRRLIALSEYKRRQAPPIIRVRGRAFGSGRAMPIAAKYHF